MSTYVTTTSPVTVTNTNTAQIKTTSNVGLFVPMALVNLTLSANAYVRFSNISPSEAFPSTGWTIDFWWYAQGSPQTQQLMEVGTSNTTLTITFTTSRTIAVVIGTTILNESGFRPCALNIWHHTAVVFTGLGYYVYLDGSLELSGNSSTNIMSDATSIYLIGGTTSGFQGYIDEFRISKTARYTGRGYTLPTDTLTNILDADTYYINTFFVNNTGGTTTIPAGFGVTTGTLTFPSFSGQGSIINVSATNTSFFTNNTAVKYGNFSLRSTNTTANQQVSFTGIETSIAFPSTGWTIEFWAFISTTLSSGTPRTLLMGSSATFLNMYLTNVINLTVATNSSGTTTATRTGSTVITTSAWHHFAVVFTGTVYILYADGVRVGNTFGSSFNCGSLLPTLRFAGGGANAIQGYFDDFRISKTARYTASTYTQPSAGFSTTLDTNVYYYNDFEAYGNNSTTLPPGYSVGTYAEVKGNEAIGESFLLDSTAFTTTSVGSWTLDSTISKFGITSLLAPSSGYLQVEGLDTDVAFPPTGWTIEAWFYFTSIPNNAIIGLVCVPANFVFQAYLYNGLVTSSFGTGGTSWNIAYKITTTPLDTNVWHHMAWGFDGSQYRVWVNGYCENQVVSSALTNFTAGGGKILIGSLYSQNVYQNSYVMRGYIDDFHISSTYRYPSNTIPSLPNESFATSSDPDTYYLNTFEGTHGQLSPSGFKGGFVTGLEYPFTTVYTSLLSSNVGAWLQDGVYTTGNSVSIISGITNSTFSNSYTIEGYFYVYQTNTTNGVQGVLCSLPVSTSTSNNCGVEVAFVNFPSTTSSTFRVRLRLGNGDTSYNILDGSTNTTGQGISTLNPKIWYHLALQYDGSVYKVFVNGVLEVSFSSTTKVPTSLFKYMVVGACFDKGGRSSGLFNPRSYQNTLAGYYNLLTFSNVDKYSTSNIAGATYTIPSQTTLLNGDSSTVFGYGVGVPGSPNIGIATYAVGTTSVTLNWTRPVNDGGSDIFQYSVTSSPTTTTQTTSANSLTFTGLSFGTTYTFSVKAVNSYGTSSASANSNSITPYTTPGTPTIGTPSVVAGNTFATVRWTPPVSTGGNAIFSYSIISTPATTIQSALGNVTSMTFTGLAYATAYTFRVAAINEAGTGSYSGNSSSITPTGVPDAPPITSAYLSSTTTVTLTWTRPSTNGSNITGYTAYSTPATITRSLGTNSTSTTFPNLTLGVDYTFYIAAINSVGTGPISTSETITPSTTPSAPIIGTATVSASSTSATVNWSAPTTNGGNNIQSWIIISSPSTTTQTTTGRFTRSMTFTGLNYGVAYTFIVAAVNGNGTGDYSDPSNTITPFRTPDAPTIHTPTIIGGETAATITWQQPSFDGGSDITSYSVISTPTTTTQTSTQTSIYFTGLTIGTSYTFRVRAINAAGSGTLSGTSSSITPFAITPGIPTIGTASISASSTSATVRWTAPTSNGGSAITGYRVLSQPGGVVRTASAGSTSLVFTGLVYATPYTFSVAATNSVGTGTYSEESNTITPFTVPGAPTIVGTPSYNAGDTAVTLTWEPPLSNGGSTITQYSITSTPVTTTQTVSGSTTTRYFTGLSYNTSYTFRVTATNAAGAGTASSASSSVTPFRAVPFAPTIVSAGTTANSTTATITWTAPSNNGGFAITGYTIVSDPVTTTQTLGVVTTSNFTGLSYGVSYTFEVAALNSQGTGAYSSPSSVVTPYTLPGLPTSVSASTVAGQTSATVSWVEPSNNGGRAITGYTLVSIPPTTTQNTVDSSTTWKFTGLNSGQQYTFTVAAKNLAGTGGSSDPSNTVVVANTPGVCTIGEASISVSSTTATITWTEPLDNGGSSITSYSVVSIPTTVTQFAPGTNTSIAFWGLSYGVSYTFSVAAVNAMGIGYYSDQTTPITPYTVPATPIIGVASVTAGNTSATINWVTPSDNGRPLLGYTIVSTPATTTQAVSPNLTTFTFQGLTYGTAYRFKILAINAVGAGEYSSDSNSVTPYRVPDAPSAISASILANEKQATVSWVPPAFNGGSPITSYYVVSTPTTATKTTQETSVIFTGLNRGTSYTFRVSAFNLAGQGASSVDSSPIVPFKKHEVTNVMAGLNNRHVKTSVHTTKANAETFAITVDDTTYNSSTGVAYATKSSVPQKALVLLVSIKSYDTNSVGVTDFSVNPITVSFSIPHANTSNTLKLYKLTSINNPTLITSQPTGFPAELTYSVQDNVWTGTIISLSDFGILDDLITLPGTPTIGTASVSANSTSAFVSWSPPAIIGGTNITSYSIISNPNTTTQTVSGSTTSINFIGLSYNTSYTFQVAAINVLGLGLYSSASNSVTPYTTPDAPTSVTASVSPSNTSASVSWVAPVFNGGSPITGYSVVSNPTTTIQTASAGANSLSFTGLTFGVAYTFTVSAVNLAGTGTASVASNSVTPYTTSDPPTSVATSISPSNTSASVSWVAPVFNGGSPITGYSVVSNPTTTTQTVSAGASSLNFTGLSYGTAYTFTVAAINSVGTGVYSASSNSITPTTTPATPTIGLASVSASSTSATITWTAPFSNGSAITGYSIVSNPETTTQTTGSGSTSMTFTGLTYGTAYTFTVAAVNTVGMGSYSSPSNSVTPYTTPGTPTIGIATAITNSSSTTVTWVAPSSNGGSTITGYSIISSPATITQTASSGTTSMTFTGLTVGTAYTFAVAAVNVAGTGTYSSASNSVITTTVPGTPTIGTVSISTSTTTATVTWTAPLSNGGTVLTGYSIRSSPATTTQSASSGSTAMSFTGLNYGTAYTFTVAAINAVGTGSYSSSSNSITPTTTPGIPTIGTASVTANSTSATVVWTAPATTGGTAITGYSIKSSPVTTTQTAFSGSTSSTFTGLTYGTNYTFTVAATNAVGTGSYSSPSNSVKPYTTPGTPTIGVTTITANVQAALVTWTAPANNGGSPITGYTILSLPPTTTQNVPSTSTSFSFPNLIQGTPYVFKVAATNAAGNGSYSEFSNPVTAYRQLQQTNALPGLGGRQVSATLSASKPALSAFSLSVNNDSFTSSSGIGYSTASSSIKNAVLMMTIGGTDSSGSSITDYSSYPITTSFSLPHANTSNSLAIYKLNSSTDLTVMASQPSGYPSSMTYSSTEGSWSASFSSLSTVAILDLSVTTPGAPTIGTADVTASSTTATVTWTAPSSNGGDTITGYYIISSPTTTTQSASSDTTSTNFTGLTYGVAYTFQVAATNSQGTGTFSSSSNSVTPFTTPNAPTSVTASVTASSTFASLSWIAPSDNGGSSITSYSVVSSPATTTQTASAGSTSLSFTGLVYGTTYTFTVTAVNAAGSGTASASSNSVIPITVPSKVLNVVSKVVAQESFDIPEVLLSWSPPLSNGGTSVIEYQIVSSPYTSVTTVASGVTNTTITNLTFFESYTFSVYAVNEVGASEESDNTNSTTPFYYRAKEVVEQTMSGLNDTAIVATAGTTKDDLSGITITVKDDVFVTFRSNQFVDDFVYENKLVLRVRITAVNVDGIRVSDFTSTPIELAVQMDHVDTTHIVKVYKVDTKDLIMIPQPSGFPTTMRYDNDTGLWTTKLTSLSDFILMDIGSGATTSISGSTLTSSTGNFKISTTSSDVKQKSAAWKSILLYNKHDCKVIALCRVTRTALIKGLKVYVDDQILSISENDYLSQLQSTYLSYVRHLQIFNGNTLSVCVNMLTGHISDLDHSFIINQPSFETSFNEALDGHVEYFPDDERVSFDILLNNDLGDYLTIKVSPATSQKQAFSEILFRSAQSTTSGYTGEFFMDSSANKL